MFIFVKQKFNEIKILMEKFKSQQQPTVSSQRMKVLYSKLSSTGG
jgi:hypothetical protein